MNDLVGIVLTFEESNILLRALIECKGNTRKEEAHLNAIYLRTVEAQILTTKDVV